MPVAGTVRPELRAREEGHLAWPRLGRHHVTRRQARSPWQGAGTAHVERRNNGKALAPDHCIALRRGKARSHEWHPLRERAVAKAPQSRRANSAAHASCDKAAVRSVQAISAVRLDPE